MWKDNKYAIWYNNIINNSKSRLTEVEGETHHILPKCLGGTDADDNLVKLTYREHFIVHWLLVYMSPSKRIYNQMARAFMAMSTLHDGRRLAYSRFFEVARKRFADAQKGHEWSDEQRQKRSEINIRQGRWKGDDNPSRKLAIHPRKGKPGTFKGRRHTEETKKLLRENNIMKKDPYAASRVRWTEEERAKHSEKMKLENNNARYYKLTNIESKESFTIKGLKPYCEANGWNYGKVIRYKKEGRPYLGFLIETL